MAIFCSSGVVIRNTEYKWLTTQYLIDIKYWCSNAYECTCCIVNNIEMMPIFWDRNFNIIYYLSITSYKYVILSVYIYIKPKFCDSNWSSFSYAVAYFLISCIIFLCCLQKYYQRLENPLKNRVKLSKE